MEDKDREYLRVFLEVCYRNEVLTPRQFGHLYHAMGDSTVLRACALASLASADLAPTADACQIGSAADQIVSALEDTRHTSLSARYRKMLVDVACTWLTVVLKDQRLASTLFTRIAQDNAQFMAVLENVANRYEIRGGSRDLLRVLVAYAQ